MGVRARNIPFLKRFIPSAHKRAVRLLWPGDWGVARREGAMFLLNLKNCHDRGMFLRGINEPEQRQFFFAQAQAKACNVFIDIGSNVGIYSVFAALQPTSRAVFAYEPNEICYDRLRANLMVNNLLEKVKTRRAAVSDRNGYLPFTIAPHDNDLLSMIDENGKDSVPSVRLDDELTLQGQNMAIKLDIEGHELAALSGMNNLLRNNDCFLQVECWEANAAPFAEAIKALGYGLIHRIKCDYYFARAAA